MRTGLTQKQIIILLILAVLDCLIIAGLGAVVATQALKVAVPASPAIVSPSAAAPTPLIRPTDRPVPPTWTPSAYPTPPEVGELYTFTHSRCLFDVPEGANVTCGYVIVPETRGDPPAGIIQLAVAIYHSTNPEPAPDPVIYLSGGPGGDALDDLALGYDDFIVPLLWERDVIVFDQRGVGKSQPALTCYEYIATIKRDLEYRFTDEEQSTEYLEGVRRCQERLTARGIDLAAYTSAANASDIADIVTILGYEQANLYGVSYGTRLALTVMRDHPNVVRSAVLDSVEPIEVEIYNRHAASTDRLLRKIFDGCAADPGCNARYPDLKNVFYALRERLDVDPPVIWTRSLGSKMYKIQLTGDALTGGIFFAAYSSPVIPYLPWMIYDVAAGDYELAEWIMGISVGVESDISVGMMLSVNCHEEAFATTPEQIAVDHAVYPNTASYANDAVFGNPETLFEICETWGAAPFDPIEGQPVVSDIPALIIAGEYDPITPPEYGQQVAANLSRSHYYEFPGQTHGPSLASSCAATIARAFLSDPWAEPDASCIATMSGPDFIR